jgi:hypothetical protein
MPTGATRTVSRNPRHPRFFRQFWLLLVHHPCTERIRRGVQLCPRSDGARRHIGVRRREGRGAGAGRPASAHQHSASPFGLPHAEQEPSIHPSHASARGACRIPSAPDPAPRTGVLSAPPDRWAHKAIATGSATGRQFRAQRPPRDTFQRRHTGAQRDNPRLSDTGRTTRRLPARARPRTPRQLPAQPRRRTTRQLPGPSPTAAQRDAFRLGPHRRTPRDNSRLSDTGARRDDFAVSRTGAQRTAVCGQGPAQPRIRGGTPERDRPRTQRPRIRDVTPGFANPPLYIGKTRPPKGEKPAQWSA